MIRFSVGEVVDAGACPRRFGLLRRGALRDRPRGTPVGAIVHDTIATLVVEAGEDAALRAALAPRRPSPERVAGEVLRLAQTVFVDRTWPRLERFRADDLQLAGRAVGEVARLLATQVRRARVAGAKPDEAVARCVLGSEEPFELRVPTLAGEALVAGRLDLLIGNEVDGRVEVWELKTYADDGLGLGDEQALLYALALRETGRVPARSSLRAAVLHVHGAGVSLRALPAPGEDALARLAERLASMAAWERDVDAAPRTDDRARCLRCPVRGACWAEAGPTLALAGETSAAPIEEPAPSRPTAPPSPGAPTSTSGEAGGSDVEVLIGHDDQANEVRWQPNDRERRLDNFGFLVTGDSGSGKTQTLRAVVGDCRAAGLPTLVLDFKNDFSEPAFLSSARLRGHDLRDRGLPYNPLTLLPQSGRIRAMDAIYKLEAILTRVLGLGVQQGAALNQAMQEAYRRRGVPLGGMDSDRPVPGPSFAEVLDLIDGPATLRPRLQPLVDLGLLRGDDEVESSLAALLDEGVVLDAHQVALGPIAEAVVEIALLGVHGFLLAGDQPRRLTRLLVLDEAHRVAGSPQLGPLLREGRAFGLGFAIGTQFPGDLDDDLQGSLGTRLFLHNVQDAHRRAVVRHLCGSTSGAEATRLLAALRDLQTHEGFLVNAHHRPYRRVTVLPHYRRMPASAEVEVGVR